MGATTFFYWRFFNNWLVTANKDGTIPLNARIIAEVVADSINPSNRALIEAAPDLQGAAIDFHRWFKEFVGAEAYAEINCDQLRALLAAIHKSGGDQ